MWNLVAELTQLAAGWPLVASLGLLAAARGWQVSRRRTKLNEALHELRRPLQALALAGPSGGLEESLQAAAAALERLEREVNGEVATAPRAPVAIGPLLEASAGRWRRACRDGGRIEVDPAAAEATVLGDREALARALDNLVLNAVEHGGREIRLEATRAAAGLRVSVADTGVAPVRGRPPSEVAARALARLRGRDRHGHGLRVVRRTAAEHGGSFHLRRSASGAEAVIELPLAAEGGPR